MIEALTILVVFLAGFGIAWNIQRFHYNNCLNARYHQGFNDGQAQIEDTIQRRETNAYQRGQIDRNVEILRRIANRRN